MEAPDYLSSNINSFQNKMCNFLQEKSEVYLFAGRLGVLIVAPVDFIAESLKLPLAAIECLAYAILNLFGAAFNEACTLEHAFLEGKKFVLLAIVSPFQAITSAMVLLQNFSKYLLEPNKLVEVDRLKLSRE